MLKCLSLISAKKDCELRKSGSSKVSKLCFNFRENYIFTCQCPKCLSQSDDPDCTSSEEEEEDMEDC